MSDDIQPVLAALDERAASDPRLERYRVSGGGIRALDSIPAGWTVSDAVTRIATDGGWWPGEWMFPTVDNTVGLVLTGHDHTDDEAEVRWLGVGTVWERDCFWTPALRGGAGSAPLFGFSNQALWWSIVFPTEAAMLEAFIITYDELGLDERGEINPFFVEWVTKPPPEHEQAGADVVHHRLTELSRRWTTSHRCWHDDAMPYVRWDPGYDDVPAGVVDTILGVGPTF
jgi:hypothetical protein